jgi:hypothetical protein
MSKLDTKQMVLVAIYTEYQKDIPAMDKTITAADLGIDREAFYIALLKLTNEGLINGVEFTKGGRGNKILGAITTNIMMTSKGIDYVELKLGITPTLSAGEKVKEVTKKVTAWGYNELKDIGIKVTAEIVKGVTGIK